MTARTRPPEKVQVSVTVKLSIAEANALAQAVFTCTSIDHWREAERALAAVKEATTRRLQAGS